MKLYSTGDSSNNGMGQQESEQRYFQQIDVGRWCEWCPTAGCKMVQAHTNEFLNICWNYLPLSILECKICLFWTCKKPYTACETSANLSFFLSRGLDPWHTSTAIDWCTKCWGLNAIHRVQGITWDHRNRLSGKTVRKSFQEFQFWWNVTYRALRAPLLNDIEKTRTFPGLWGSERELLIACSMFIYVSI